MQVGPFGKGLEDHPEPRLPRLLLVHRPRKNHEGKPRVKGLHREGDGPRRLPVAAGLEVERPVGLDVVERKALRLEEGGEGPDLVEHVGVDLLGA